MTVVLEDAVRAVKNGFLVYRKKRWGFALRVVQATEEIICERVRHLLEVLRKYFGTTPIHLTERLEDTEMMRQNRFWLVLR